MRWECSHCRFRCRGDLSTKYEAAEEAGKALDLIEYVAGIFGLKKGEHYRFRLSQGDRANGEKYYKNDAAWEKAESLLRELMKKRGGEFEEAKDEAAFYGPKIDVQMKNANGKEDTEIRSPPDRSATLTVRSRSAVARGYPCRFTAWAPNTYQRSLARVARSANATSART